MTSIPARRVAVLAVLALFLGMLTGLVSRPAHAATGTSITVSGIQPGRAFDGIGAISGGGGNSRLLIDYPEPQRTQILDYLFKPGYGAALQVLKVEIGGDTNSTDGAEASHEHARGVVDCNQGYEWWLMAQAKARNPNIKLAGLSWGAPGWVGSGNFWSQDMVDYLMSWLGCASGHGLTIDYLGGWNERNYNVGWYENLHSSIAANGYATKVVGDDSSWGVADAMASDPAFAASIDVVGSHYPCGYLGSYTSCPSTANAVNTGKPLWASENGSQDYNTGAAAVARAVNRDYIDGKMTAYMNWPVIAALYPNLYFSTDGMSLANQPWSGSYSIGKTTWVTAQTAQFAQPGWHYIDSATGYLGGNRANGSYVTLKSTNNSDYSSIIETMDASAAQTATFTVTGGLSTGQVHVWATNVNSSNSADYFVHTQDVTPSGGSYTLTLQPGYVYSVTTTTGQGKGSATSPASSAMALPYSDNFETAAGSTSPKYFTDMNGAFATVACGGGRSGQCVRQMAPTTPIRWTDEAYNGPYTFMGDQSWTNYTVSADTMFEQSSTVELLGRLNQQNRNDNGLNAYHLRVGSSGAWSILKSDQNWTFTTLASGTVAALGTNSWHSIALSMQGSTLTAKIDGASVGSANDATYSAGQAGLGVTGYQTDQFDNYSVTTGTTNTESVSVTSPGSQSGTVGTAVSLQIVASDSQGKALSFSASGLPAGLSISSSGRISGSPSTAGSSTVTVTASSGTASGSATFGFTVATSGGGSSRLAQSLMRVKFVDSQETAAENTPGTNVLDGNTSTFWGTQWSAANPTPPHEIQLDLGASYSVTDLYYLPRQDSANGRIAGYQVYVSTDGITWGSAVGTGTWTSGTTEQDVHFTAKTGRYVRLVATSEVNGNPWTTVAELNVGVGGGTPPPPPPGRIAQSGMTVKYVDSQETSAENTPGTNVLDGNASTFWGTQWSAANPTPPHEIQIDLGRSYSVTDLYYLPRQDSANGRIAGYQVYVSSDGITWGTAVNTGTWPNGTAEQDAHFTAKTGRYVRLVATSEVNGNPWTTVAELNIAGT